MPTIVMLAVGCGQSVADSDGVGPTLGTCQSDVACAKQFPDIGECRLALCVSGQCEVRVRSDGTECSDGSCAGLVYRAAGTCLGGSCHSSGPQDCATGDACQIGACSTEMGCTTSPAPDDTTCDADGSACTPEDHCLGGACLAGPLLACDDGNPCSSDGCDGSTGDCVHQGLDGPCDDGNACTEADACVAAKCSGAVVPCGDGDPCTDDICSPESGCAYDAIAGCLDQLNPCEGAEGPVDCDDDNPCSTDSCDEQQGCIYLAITDACDDGNACTTSDTCQGLACIGIALSCGDGNPCTDDGCAPNSGCLSSPNSAACDDDNPCTDKTICNDGQCQGGSVIDCDDGNPCTIDICTAAAGCQWKESPFGLPCDDGNPCTADGGCETGACVQFADAQCNDGQPCTKDSCDAVLGCVHVPQQGCPLCTGKPSCIGEALPKFALEDQNANSPSFQQAVAPHAWKGQPIVMIAVHGY